jgi:acetyltransferase-like isoleucine patch superfamily enzyme
MATAQIAETAVVYPGVELGEDVVVGDYAVVGKQPVLGRRSTAPREELPPLVVGDGASILAGAVVFAGTRLGPGVIVGDQACVRERCELAEEVIVGRGAFIENHVSVGARTRIQANAYVTAYSTLEEDVFLAPCVVTTNDNFMGRTEKRHAARKGPTIRRGARIGGGAVLLPGVEIGAEAFVGAGAVVLADVLPRTVVVGNPARQIREVPDEELLGPPR